MGKKRGRMPLNPGNPNPGNRGDEQRKNTFACRSCGTQRNDQKDKCPACGASPVCEQKIDADLLIGDSGWYIVVRTTENGIMKGNMPFIFTEDGKGKPTSTVSGAGTSSGGSPIGFVVPAKASGGATTPSNSLIEYSDENGIAVIQIGWTNSRKHVRFFLVGTRAPSKELDIPRKSEPRPKFWSKDCETPSDIWKAFFKKR